jgi:hypothetical protein
MVKRTIVPTCGLAPSDNAGSSKVEPPCTSPEAAHRRAAAGRARRNLDEMNATHHEYRQDVGRRVVDMFDLGVSQMFPTDSDGFSYSAEAMSEIKRIKAEMITVLNNGPTNFDVKRHEAMRTQYLATIAQADGGFVELLTKLISGVAPG